MCACHSIPADLGTMIVLIIEACHTWDFLKKYECFPYSEVFRTEAPGYEGKAVSIGGCALHNSSTVSWRNSQRRNLFLEQGTCCWLPDILSCWRIQKWCLTAAGPTPTLPALWNVLCLGHSPSHQGSDCGEGRSQLSRPWPELSLQKEGICFDLGLPTQSPTLLPEPSCLQKAAHCSSLQLLLLCECSTPNVEIRDRVYKKL